MGNCKMISWFSQSPPHKLSPSLLLREFLPLFFKDSVPFYCDLLFPHQLKTLPWSLVGMDSSSLLTGGFPVCSGRMSQKRREGGPKGLVASHHLLFHRLGIHQLVLPLDRLRLSFSYLPSATPLLCLSSELGTRMDGQKEPSVSTRNPPFSHLSPTLPSLGYWVVWPSEFVTLAEKSSSKMKFSF